MNDERAVGITRDSDMPGKLPTLTSHDHAIPEWLPKPAQEARLAARAAARAVLVRNSRLIGTDITLQVARHFNLVAPQPASLERQGLVKTAPLFAGYMDRRSFDHSDDEAKAELNACRADISGCFLFPAMFLTGRRDQMLVVRKR